MDVGKKDTRSGSVLGREKVKGRKWYLQRMSGRE